ncbi:MAG: hypothetical protein NTV01_07025 [Bacteroidia bacterium]|nr:hypothetical protein [Bacteroidia bacterium]
MTQATDESKIINWPNFGPYQPDGDKAMKSTESSGPVHQETTGIGPETQDPQTVKSGRQ